VGTVYVYAIISAIKLLKIFPYFFSFLKILSFFRTNRIAIHFDSLSGPFLMIIYIEFLLMNFFLWQISGISGSHDSF